jgi:protein-tyrosine phosphatase
VERSVVAVTTTLWIDLDGADNMRDVGGLPTWDGPRVRPGRLFRSDSLQELSNADVRRLVVDRGVRAVADLRTSKEVLEDGPGPMSREPAVRVEHHSLYPEAAASSDVAAADAAALGLLVSDEPLEPVLPSSPHSAAASGGSVAHAIEKEYVGAVNVYLRYLDDRADSIVAALRLISYTDGATIVHCAAGKDRTGVVVAIALREVGVTPQAIAADYARTAERIGAVFRRLGKRTAYADDVAVADSERQRPRAQTMEKLLAAGDELHGGAGTWLRANGWTEGDALALRNKLLN